MRVFSRTALHQIELLRACDSDSESDYVGIKAYFNCASRYESEQPGQENISMKPKIIVSTYYDVEVRCIKSVLSKQPDLGIIPQSLTCY